MGQHLVLDLDFSCLQCFSSILWIRFWPVPFFLGI